MHSRQLQQHDFNAQIRAMEQQHLQSQANVPQSSLPSNPYAWPQINDAGRQVVPARAPSSDLLKIYFTDLCS